MMSDLQRALEERVRAISELSDGDLAALMSALERAYIHGMIEQSLRNPASVSRSASVA
jgi:hypothetical protein